MRMFNVLRWVWYFSYHVDNNWLSPYYGGWALQVTCPLFGLTLRHSWLVPFNPSAPYRKLGSPNSDWKRPIRVPVQPIIKSAPQSSGGYGFSIWPRSLWVAEGDYIFRFNFGDLAN